MYVFTMWLVLGLRTCERMIWYLFRINGIWCMFSISFGCVLGLVYSNAVQSLSQSAGMTGYFVLPFLFSIVGVFFLSRFVSLSIFNFQSNIYSFRVGLIYFG